MYPVVASCRGLLLAIPFSPHQRRVEFGSRPPVPRIALSARHPRSYSSLPREVNFRQAAASFLFRLSFCLRFDVATRMPDELAFGFARHRVGALF